ncbi:MAG: hypothetical protein PWQ77_1682 [Kosmotogales bacterium]|nr:hypothetical protein [Kosmotogales bacterium]
MNISRKRRRKYNIKTIILNLNPCYDHWIILKKKPEIPDVIRGDRVIRLIDGKGLNIARVLKTIFSNGNFKCINVLGGNIGKIIRDYCEKESFNVNNFWIKGDNRINTAIVYEYDNKMKIINEPGPIMSENEVINLKNFVDGAIECDSRVVVSGSATRGFTGRDLRDMIVRFRDRCSLAVDIAGEWLNEVVKVRPDILKINFNELKMAFDIDINNFEDVESFKKRYNIKTLIITMEEKGSICFTDDRIYKVFSSKTYSNFSVGSGDSFFAGLLNGLDKGFEIEKALKSANACGAANSLNYGSGMFSVEEYEKMLEETVFEVIK